MIILHQLNQFFILLSLQIWERIVTSLNCFCDDFQFSIVRVLPRKAHGVSNHELGGERIVTPAARDYRSNQAVPPSVSQKRLPHDGHDSVPLARDALLHFEASHRVQAMNYSVEHVALSAFAVVGLGAHHHLVILQVHALLPELFRADWLQIFLCEGQGGSIFAWLADVSQHGGDFRECLLIQQVEISFELASDGCPV